MISRQLITNFNYLKNNYMIDLKRVILLLMTTLLFTACSQEIDVSSETPLVGVWNVNDLEFDILINGQDISAFFDTQLEANIFIALLTTELEESFENASLEFKSNNTYTSTFPGEPSVSGTYTKTDSQLILDAGTEDETTFTILTQNANALNLQAIEEDNSTDLDQDGINDQFRLVFDISLTK